MADMDFKFPDKLPADLPTDWIKDQVVPHNGEDDNKPEQYGFNYLMKQVNAAQLACNMLSAISSTLTAEQVKLLNTVETGLDAANVKQNAIAGEDGKPISVNGALGSLNENKEELIKNAAAKTTLVDADTLPLSDSAASSVTKKITFTNIKAILKTYFDTLYNKVMVNNTLTSASTTEALSAAQGKALNENIETRAKILIPQKIRATGLAPVSITIANDNANYYLIDQFGKVTLCFKATIESGYFAAAYHVATLPSAFRPSEITVVSGALDAYLDTGNVWGIGSIRVHPNGIVYAFPAFPLSVNIKSINVYASFWAI